MFSYGALNLDADIYWGINLFMKIISVVKTQLRAF